MCCSSMFPSALSLRSTDSASGCPILFVSFIATVERSDFSGPCVIGFDSCLPDADHSEKTGAVGLEISRFPNKERLCMPGSKTTQGRTGTRKIAPVRVAFHHANGVGTLN